jgi:hypothetical protein
MKKYSVRFSFICALAFPALCFSSEVIYHINSDLNDDGKLDSITLKHVQREEFLSLNIEISGGRTFQNSGFISAGKSKGGISFFQGVGVDQGAIIFHFYSCGPEYSICSSRSLTATYKDDEFFVVGEHAYAFSEMLSSTSSITYRPAVRLTEIDHPFFMGKGDEIRYEFEKKYGTCLGSLGREAVETISEKLEMQDQEILSNNSCITRRLILELLEAGFISTAAYEAAQVQLSQKNGQK